MSQASQTTKTDAEKPAVVVKKWIGKSIFQELKIYSGNVESCLRWTKNTKDTELIYEVFGKYLIFFNSNIFETQEKMELELLYLHFSLADPNPDNWLNLDLLYPDII